MVLGCLMYLHYVACDLVVGEMHGHYLVPRGTETCTLQSSSGCLERAAEPDIPPCRLCGFAIPRVEGYGLLLYWADAFLCVLLHGAE